MVLLSRGDGDGALFWVLEVGFEDFFLSICGDCFLEGVLLALGFLLGRGGIIIVVVDADLCW